MRVQAKARIWLVLTALMAGLAVLSIPGFLVVAAAQFSLWWASGPLAVKAFGAAPSTPSTHPRLHRQVQLLADEAGIPMPKLYTAPMGGTMNAAASGRTPAHAVVIVSTELVEAADNRQLRGVMAHELAHVANRDAAIMSVVAALAYIFVLIAYIAGQGDEHRPSPLFVAFAVMGAALLQAAVSRHRELSADRFGATLAGDPDGLGDALLSIEKHSRGMTTAFSPALSSLQTAGPGPGRGPSEVLRRLFATHPPTEKRIERLRLLRDSGECDRTHPPLI